MNVKLVLSFLQARHYGLNNNNNKIESISQSSNHLCVLLRATDCTSISALCCTVGHLGVKRLFSSIVRVPDDNHIDMDIHLLINNFAV